MGRPCDLVPGPRALAGNGYVSCGHGYPWPQETSYRWCGQRVSPAWGGVTPLARSASGAVLDGCAGYCGLAHAALYLDALGVHFRRLGHQNLQNAVVGCGFDSVGLHMAGQGDQPAERAVAALSPVELLCGRVARGVPFALDGHRP